MTIAHHPRRFYARLLFEKAREDLMTYWNRRTILLAGAALGLTACGGGGGGANSTPAPTLTPTPSPTPAGVKIFPNITASTDFAVLGLEASEGNGPSSTLTTAGFSVRYDASSGTYIMDFPSTEPAAFGAYVGEPQNADYWNGGVGEHEATVRNPANPSLPLTYTTLATYGTFSQGTVPAFGWLAFGSATLAGGVPVTGTASYQAEVMGSTIDRYVLITGSAMLDFNFGAGTLSGHLDLDNSVGRYDFLNTLYASGSTTFSGQLSKTGIAQLGAFDGQFTGPNAQELMARWSAPYIDPVTSQQSPMFGVLVGKQD